MRTAPTVSVVVTAERRAALDATVRSVVEQDHDGDIEVLVVLDRDAPDLPDVARTTHRRRVHVVRNQRTPGRAGMVNTGLLLATGGLVAVAEAGDVWFPTRLSRQLAAIRTGVDVVSCAATFLVAGRRTDASWPAHRVTVRDLAAAPLRSWSLHTVLLRRRTGRRADELLDESLGWRGAEDRDWLLRQARRTSVRALPHRLVRLAEATDRPRPDARAVVHAVDVLLARHPELRGSASTHAWLVARRAAAHARHGDRGPARADVVRALALHARRLGADRRPRRASARVTPGLATDG